MSKPRNRPPDRDPARETAPRRSSREEQPTTKALLAKAQARAKRPRIPRRADEDKEGKGELYITNPFTAEHYVGQVM